MKVVMMVVMVFSFVAVGCMEMDTEQGTVTYDQSLAEKPICGGIAGFQCPEGMKCLIKDSYPDASGVCVGPQEKTDCAAVKCSFPACEKGFEPVQVGGGCCNYKCKRTRDAGDDTGTCTQPSDCEGLIHPLCVGSWSCQAGACAWACDSEPVSF